MDIARIQERRVEIDASEKGMKEEYAFLVPELDRLNAILREDEKARHERQRKEYERVDAERRARDKAQRAEREAKQKAIADAVKQLENGEPIENIKVKV